MRNERERSNTQVDYSDYADILSKYKQSVISTTGGTGLLQSPKLESIIEDIEKNDNQEEQQFSIDQMQKEAENCQRLTKKSSDFDLVNQNDSIYSRILGENELKQRAQDKKDCCICHQQFGVMRKQKQCKFCGNCVCSDHGKKKRRNPQISADSKDPKKFVTICEICDDKYIRQTVEKSYVEKRNALAQEILQLDSSSQTILQEIKNLQNKLSSIQEDSIKKQGEHKQTQNELIFKVTKLEQEIKNIQNEEIKQGTLVHEIKKDIDQFEYLQNEKLKEGKLKLQQQNVIEQEIERVDIECQKAQLDVEKINLELQVKKSQKTQQQNVPQKQIETYQQYISIQESGTMQQIIPNANPQPLLEKESQQEQDEKSCCQIM